MGKKLNGRLFRVNGKPFRVNGELFRVHGKLFHIDFSSCEGSFLAIIGMFGWVVRRFQDATPTYFYNSRGKRRDTQKKNFFLLLSAKNAEGMKEHRQVVKCEARNPC